MSKVFKTRREVRLMRNMMMKLRVDEESILGKLDVVERAAEELSRAAWDLRKTLCCSESMDEETEKPEE